jgi:hypothetical protein
MPPGPQVPDSAESHGKVMVTLVDQGKIQFTPRIGIGFMGFGVRY